MGYMPLIPKHQFAPLVSLSARSKKLDPLNSGTHSIHKGQLVLVLEPRFRLPEHVIDLLLHPGLDLRVVRQNSKQMPEGHCGSAQTWGKKITLQHTCLNAC